MNSVPVTRSRAHVAARSIGAALGLAALVAGSTPALAAPAHAAPATGTPVPAATTRSAPRTPALWPARGAVAPVVPRIHWTTCDDAAQRRLHLQCGTVQVPIDYAHPRGGTITLDLARHRATGRRIGSLFVNPGGPGEAATEHMERFLKVLGTTVTSRFDVVGMDPRGVGLDSQAACWSRHAQPATLQSYPTTLQQARVQYAQDSYQRHACASTGRPIIDHMTTADVARDMDLLRASLGDRQLTYYGVSYGTVLGSTYAAMFPSRVRAIILDGVVNPVQWFGTSTGGRVPVSARTGSGAGADETLRAAFAACRAAGAKRCPHGATIAREWDALIAHLRKHPIASADGDITLSNTLSSALGQLYSPDEYTPLMQWIHADYVTMTHPGRRVAGVRAPQASTPGLRAVDPTVPQADDSQWFDTFKMAGVMCGETRNPINESMWWRYAQEHQSSWFTPAWTWNSSLCSSWPASKQDVWTGPFSVRTAHPVLVVGNRHDPATPLSSAQSTAKLLPGARLLTVDAFGHTAADQSRCASAAMRNYLLTTRLPRAGLVCRADRSLF